MASLHIGNTEEDILCWYRICYITVYTVVQTGGETLGLAQTEYPDPELQA
jgi:hypothetical protein